MNDFLDQVEAAADGLQLYYLALAGTLVIPDVCGALEAPDGEANRRRYEQWFDAHVAPLYAFGGRSPVLTGEDCYRFRCSFLHQGRTHHPRGGYQRILFVEPGATGNVFHMNVMGDALNIDARQFCFDMVGAARRWVTTVAGSDPYESNLDKSVRRYPDGLAPYIGGMPVIS